MTEGDASPDDVLMLVKEHMNKTYLAQKPLVLIQHCDLQSMPLTGPTSLLPRNLLPEKMIKEYSKTATLVENPPWHLNRAATYLREWVSANMESVQKDAPSFSLGTKSETGSGESVLAEYDRLQEFAPDPPKQIKVEMGPPPLADAKSKAKAKTPRPKTSPAQAKAKGSVPKAKASPKVKAKAKAKVKAKAKAATVRRTLKRPAAAPHIDEDSPEVTCMN